MPPTLAYTHHTYLRGSAPASTAFQWAVTPTSIHRTANVAPPKIRYASIHYPAPGAEGPAGPRTFNHRGFMLRFRRRPATWLLRLQLTVGHIGIMDEPEPPSTHATPPRFPISPI